MNYNELMDRLDLQSTAFAVAIIVIALCLVLFLNRRRIVLRWREWRIQRNLDRIGSEQIRHLICPDGLDGHFDIDRLALLHDRIVIVSYKPYDGNIFAAERISEWTQVVGKKSFKFENPLFELENQLASLRLQVGNVPLEARLFFNYSAIFPKGRPENVLLPGDIPGYLLGEYCAPAIPEIAAAWVQLKGLKQSESGEAEVRLKT